ncbi:MAG TPA: hypothetical protein VKP11_05180, partial [Frankiaceae bacterium]|nr:hypothetical protein [Frankiaceae bacterium]
AVPSPPVLWLGAATDGLHAASAAVLAVADRQWRRAGTADAALAGAFGVLSALAARSPRS